VVRRELPIANLPPELAGASLVQLSDMHVGPTVDDDYIARVFATVRGWRPDLVVYTGDFITNSRHTMEKMKRLYAGAPHGRLGTVGILGNHDYGRHWAHPEIAARVESELTAHGITILRNDVREVAGLQIAGFDDLWAEAFNAPAVFAKLDLTRPHLALSHNPDTADIEAMKPLVGWTLSGHTHGGQVRIPPFPPPILPVANRRYAAGAVDLGGGRRLYVSRGVGHLMPMRFGVRPEVTRFTLARA
jgi:predicted MPP superfamily phosphohydrolase